MFDIRSHRSKILLPTFLIGGLWYTWFDRDLGLSGRVFCRKKDGESESINQRLVRVGNAIRMTD